MLEDNWCNLNHPAIWEPLPICDSLNTECGAMGYELILFCCVMDVFLYIALHSIVTKYQDDCTVVSHIGHMSYYVRSTIHKRVYLHTVELASSSSRLALAPTCMCLSTWLHIPTTQYYSTHHQLLHTHIITNITHHHHTSILL